MGNEFDSPNAFFEVADLTLVELHAYKEHVLNVQQAFEKSNGAAYLGAFIQSTLDNINYHIAKIEKEIAERG